MTDQVAQITTAWNQLYILVGGLGFFALFAQAGIEVYTSPAALHRAWKAMKVAAIGLGAQVSLLTLFFALI
jgi:hypothetical protein